jgi:hypothetical protein
VVAVLPFPGAVQSPSRLAVRLRSPGYNLSPKDTLWLWLAAAHRDIGKTLPEAGYTERAVGGLGLGPGAADGAAVAVPESLVVAGGERVNRRSGYTEMGCTRTAVIAAGASWRVVLLVAPIVLREPLHMEVEWA